MASEIFLVVLWRQDSRKEWGRTFGRSARGPCGGLGEGWSGDPITLGSDNRDRKDWFSVHFSWSEKAW